MSLALPDSSAPAIPAPASKPLINWQALAAVILWCGTAPTAKYALDEFSVLSYTVLQPVTVAVVLFGILLLKRERILIPRADLRRLGLVGVFGLAVTELCFVGSLALTSVAHTVIIVSTSPLLIAVYRLLVRRASPPPKTLLGIGGGFAGVVMLVLDASGSAGGSLLGDALALAAAIGWMGVTILPTGVFAREGAMRSMAWMYSASLLLILPLSIPSLFDTVRDMPSALSWTLLGYNAIFGALIGTVLWLRSVQQGSPSRTLVYLYLQPVGSMALAALMLAEIPTIAQVSGGVLALIGVALVRRD